MLYLFSEDILGELCELLRLGLDVVISWLWMDESETKANSLKEMEQK